MNELTVGGTLRFAWELFKKRPWFMVGVFVLVYGCSTILTEIVSSGAQQAGGAFAFFAFLVNLAIQTLVGIGMTAFLLKAHDAIESAALSDAWHPANFVNYFLVTFITGLMYTLGFLALVIPGVILMTMFIFSPYLVVDKGMGPIVAMQESMRITKGSRMALFLLLLAALGLNILGVIFLIVGLAVSIPVTMLMFVHAYRILSAKATPAPVVA